MDIHLPVTVALTLGTGAPTRQGAVQIIIHGNSPALSFDIPTVSVEKLRIRRWAPQQYKVELNVCLEERPDLILQTRGNLHISTQFFPHIQLTVQTFRHNLPNLIIKGNLTLEEYLAYRVELEISHGNDQLGRTVLDKLDEWARHAPSFTLPEAIDVTKEIARSITSVR